MGIAELFEIGFFTAFINWSNLWLSALVYACIAAALAVQYFLFKKCRRAAARYWTYVTDIIAILLCEAWWQTITGWDRLAVDFIYGFFVCILLGHLLAPIIYLIRRRKISKEDEGA